MAEEKKYKSSEAEEKFEKYVVSKDKDKIPPSTETELLEVWAQLDSGASELPFGPQKKETKDRIKKVVDVYFETKKKGREEIALLYFILRESKSIKEDLSHYHLQIKHQKEIKKEENNG